MAAMDEILDVDFGSRVVALRAVGAAIGLAPNQMPAPTMANSQRNYLHWINVARVAKALPALPDLDYSGFLPALNALLSEAGQVGPPVNTGLPTIDATQGTAVGDVLSAAPGEWDNGPNTYTFGWRRNGALIGGGTGVNHTIVAADQGTTLTVTCTALNPQGTASATSAGVAIP
jgi:hypothetical protein